MAVFKCKMCGASLDIENGINVVECDYCGSKQTLPKLDDERRANLYDRANHFRRNNEFDKATSIFEQILNEDNADAEAYWSLVLCKYGVEYVEDPTSRKRIPTIHRAQYTSVFDDENYKSALQYADGNQKQLYQAEAKALNEIQKGILAISQAEEPFDVFICYKETDSNGRRTPDSVLANDLYHQLTQEGFKVFFARITLEDKLGSAYEPYIFSALNSSKVMVVLGTKPEYFNAVWVKNEWSRYLSLIKSGAKKVLIPAYKDMDAYDLPEEFAHLQAQDMSKLGFMQDLIRGIRKLAKDDKKPTTVVVNSSNSNVDSLVERMFIFLEDGNWSRANEYCEKILDLSPKCAKAYLGKLMVDVQINKADQFVLLKNPFDILANYEKFVRYASDSERDAIDKQLLVIYERIKAEKEEELRRITEEKERKKERIYQEALSAIDLDTLDSLLNAMKLLLGLEQYKEAEAKLAEVRAKLEPLLCEEIRKIIERKSIDDEKLLETHISALRKIGFTEEAKIVCEQGEHVLSEIKQQIQLAIAKQQEMERKITKRNSLVKLSIQLVMALMTVFMMFFNVVIATYDFPSTMGGNRPWKDEIYNGFSLLVNRPEMYHGGVDTAMVFDWLFLICGTLLSILTILALIKVATNKDSKLNSKNNVRTIIAFTLIIPLGYLILGFVAAKHTYSVYGTISTLAYIPFIIQIGLLILYFVCNRLLTVKTMSKPINGANLTKEQEHDDNRSSEQV